MLYEDLRTLSYSRFIQKYNKTKTKVILELIDKRFDSYQQLIEFFIKYKIDNNLASKVIQISLQKKVFTSIRTCAEEAFEAPVEEKTTKLNISKNSEIFYAFRSLEVEKLLFEMFGDLDTAQNLEKQELLLTLVNQDKPTLGYIWAHSTACQKCKDLHDSQKPFVYEVLSAYKENITHPNCKCLVKASPPTPGEYIEVRQNTISFSNLIEIIKNIFSNLTFSDIAHGILDFIGLIPVVGEIADGINAIYYAVEGDFFNAALSGISAIPVIGYISNGFKQFRTGAKVVDKAIDQTLSLTDQVNDIFKYNKNIDDIVDSYKKIDNIAPNKGIDSPKNLSKIQNDDIINKRRTWRQSEQKAEQLFSDYSRQKSFIDGNSTNYGKKGSSRPDLYKEGSSIEVKNYDLNKPEGLNRLINNLKQNSAKRTKNLPSGTVQHLIVDAAGQDLSDNIIDAIIEKILDEIHEINEVIFWR